MKSDFKRKPIDLFLLTAILTCLGITTTAQTKEGSGTYPEPREFPVSAINSEIQVDGILGEEEWQDATVIPLSYEWLPGDNLPAVVETEVLVTFSPEHLYVAFRAFDPDPSAIRAHYMQRDNVDTLIQDDHVWLMINPLSDSRRGYQFRVNPMGVQADAIFSDFEGVEDFSWDAIWKSGARITSTGYTVEIAIPFHELRFTDSDQPQSWGFQANRSYPRRVRYRLITRTNDRDLNCVLCQMDVLTGLEGLEPGRDIEIIPTLTYLDTETETVTPATEESELEGGLTGRWGITSNFKLLATINPDFSEVEADVAQLDINTRFALLFPERRTFFLEGLEFFTTTLPAVFTRTVAAPSWGLTLTGKEGPNALGVLVADDDRTLLTLPGNQRSRSVALDESNTAGVVRYRRDIGGASGVGFLLTGRDGRDYSNLVAGLDATLRLAGPDTLTLQYLHTETDYPDELAAEFGQPTDSFSGDGFLVEYLHLASKWIYKVGYQDLDPEFRADSGFIPRVDVRTVSGLIERRIQGQEGDWYTRIVVGVTGYRTEDHEGRRTDQRAAAFVNYSGPQQSYISFTIDDARTFFQGVDYDLNRFNAYVEFQPGGSTRFEMTGQIGDAVDFENGQEADIVRINPKLELKLGRHLSVSLDHLLQQLDVAGGRLFEANLSQVRLFYHFNVRTFLRLILQYQDIERDPALYDTPVARTSEDLFTQILFSYHLNPRTVLFLGYTENEFENSEIFTRPKDSRFLVKLGYSLGF